MSIFRVPPADPIYVSLKNRSKNGFEVSEIRDARENGVVLMNKLPSYSFFTVWFTLVLLTL